MIPDKLPDAPIRHWYSRYFFSDPPEILARAFYETDYRAGMHIHDFYEINVIVKGKGYHFINDQRFPVQKNDLFLLPPGYLHGYYPEEPLALYHILLHPAFFTRYAADMQRLPAYPIVMTASPPTRCDDPFRSCLRLTDREMDVQCRQLSTFADLFGETGREETAVLQHALGLYTVGTICRIYRDCYMAGGDSRVDGTAAGILHSIHYLQEHCGESLTIDDLQQQAAVSRTTLYRYYLRFTGLSPMQYLQQYRLIRARELLQQDQLSVTAVAAECGFYDGAHLDRVFRRAYGLSPRHYRRQCRP